MDNKARRYKMREGVDWYDDESGLKPKHNQKHIKTKKYWNEFKEMWCSKPVKKVLVSNSNIEVYDFKYYPLSTIKDEYGSIDYERIGLFLTETYRKGFSSGYKALDWEFVYWEYDIIRKYLGIRWSSIIDKLLIDRYIELDTSKSGYNANNNCRYFKVNKAFKGKGDDKPFNIVYVRDKRLIDSINQYYKQVVADRTGIIKYIEGTIDQSSLIINNVDTIINKIWKAKVVTDNADLLNDYISKSKKDKIRDRLSDLDRYERYYYSDLKQYYDYLDSIQQERLLYRKRVFYSLKESSFGGRISHLYSNAPKEFRRYLKIDNEELVEVDIKASQPSFLYVIFKRWYDFDNKHRNIASASIEYKERFKIISGANIDIYKYMILKTKGIKHIRGKQYRVEMKTLFYQLIFGNPINKIAGKSRRDLIVKIFGLDFYEFLVKLSKGKLGLDKNYKNLSMLLQKEEAGFLNKVMLRLIDKGLFFLPLYDSLIVKKSDADIVKSVFNEVIEDAGLTGILKIK